jgi:hypothetical protein
MPNAKTILIDVEQFLKGTATSAEKFASAFCKLFKKSPAVVQSVENFINEAAPLIVAATTLADPILVPEVAGALAIVETGLAAVEASLTAANSGQGALVALQNFATTVPALLTGLAIKNPVLSAAILRIVALVVGEAKVLLPAVESWVAQIKAAQPVAAAPTV